MQFNKALAGAETEAVERSRNTSINPIVFDSAALILFEEYKENISPVKYDDEIDIEKALEQIRKADVAFKMITDATPNSGSYSNEADYFQESWQHNFWGKCYPQLLRIKQKYDPEGLFKCHHCVGSEI